MRRIVILTISLITLAACTSAETPQREPENGEVSIAHLRTMARGESFTITDDISIEGYVIANDLYGEYYKAIVIGDGSGCIEVEIDSHTLRTLFPISARVTVMCSGLALGKYGGSISLGATPDGSYSVNRIAERDIVRYFHIDKQNPQTIAPTLMKIAQMETRRIGEYVRINDISFGKMAGTQWCDKDAQSAEWITTSRTMYDSDGDSLSVRTIGECRYAEEMIPSGRGDVCGIVGYHNGKYSLRIVNHQIIF